MIPVVKEPKELYQEFRIHEHCFFCGNPTNTWHNGTNQPVCKICAKVHKVSELQKAHPKYKPVPKQKIII
jgi:DNA polymerase III psi subunit